MDLAAAELLALNLMAEHGLPHWVFAFDRAVCRFGSCNQRKRRITLSTQLTRLNTESEVRDTLLHEIAHALVGVRAGHGPKWRRTALAIGCNALRCYGAEVRTPSHTFVGACPTCDYTIRRARRRRVSCGKCDKRFNPRH